MAGVDDTDFEPLTIRELAIACGTSTRKMRKYIQTVYPMPERWAHVSRSSRQFRMAIWSMDKEKHLLDRRLCWYVFLNFPKEVPPWAGT